MKQKAALLLHREVVCVCVRTTTIFSLTVLFEKRREDRNMVYS